MINWKRYVERLPHVVKVRKNQYPICWIEKFPDPQLLGITEFEQRKIILKTGQTNKNCVKTYLHEVVHAFSHEFDIGLTESQVKKIELALYWVLLPGNLFRKRRRK